MVDKCWLGCSSVPTTNCPFGPSASSLLDEPPQVRWCAKNAVTMLAHVHSQLASEPRLAHLCALARN